MKTEKLESLREAVRNGYIKNYSPTSEETRLAMVSKINTMCLQPGDTILFSIFSDTENRNISMTGIVYSVNPGGCEAYLSNATLVTVDTEVIDGVVLKWYERFDGKDFYTCKALESNSLVRLPADGIETIEMVQNAVGSFSNCKTIASKIKVEEFIESMTSKVALLIGQGNLIMKPSGLIKNENSFTFTGFAFEYIRGKLVPCLNKVPFGKDILKTPKVTLLTIPFNSYIRKYELI